MVEDANPKGNYVINEQQQIKAEIHQSEQRWLLSEGGRTEDQQAEDELVRLRETSEVYWQFCEKARASAVSARLVSAELRATAHRMRSDAQSARRTLNGLREDMKDLHAPTGKHDPFDL